MCGIVGYVGDKQAAGVLIEGLTKLEYRGYDSAGIAVRNKENPAEVVKTIGKIKNLIEKTDNGKAVKGNCGIGHTRWATHGAPSQINAHPHVSGNCTNSGSGPVESEVVGVHNGIIENFQELKAKLERHNYKFYSQTDTEVLIKLVDYYYRITNESKHLNGGALPFDTESVKVIPIPNASKAQQEEIEAIVKNILSRKNTALTADTTDLEYQIDKKIYEL